MHPRRETSNPAAVAGSAAFVGREPEMEALRTGLDGAFSGRGSLFLIPGEPGIGKSRLADELAVEATERGARVLWGRCWEAGGAPAYWPWIQAIRAHLRHLDPEELRVQMGREGAAHMAQMVPEVAEVLPGLPALPQVDAETARFRLFDAAAQFLQAAASVRPLVLIFDDLHVADTPSVLLLHFLATELATARILVVGAYRDTDRSREQPLAEILGELIRLPTVRRLRLSGIGAVDVGRFIEVTAGQRAAPEVIDAVHEHTEGNPLFVTEVVRLLLAEGRLAAGAGAGTVTVPPGIREVIGRRLARLSEDCRRLLTMASVLGREFDLSALEGVTGLPMPALFDLLEEAAGSGVVMDVPGTLGRLRFSHALVREAIYDDLTPARRVRLHRDVGEALESSYRKDLDAHLAELAHHFVHAAPGGDVGRAVGYARRAGERAVRTLAYEEAARLFQMAMDALELSARAEPRERCDLLLALGDARARAGEERAAKAAFLEAAELARALPDGERLARAALGYGGRFVWARAGTDPHTVRLLRAALAGLARGDSELRVRVLARLAGALRDAPEREPRTSFSSEALGMARRLGDPAPLAYALDGRYAVLLWPENPEERLRIADELLEVAEASGDREKAVQAHCYRTIALLELGNLRRVAAELAAAATIAEELGQRPQVWLVTAMRATVALFQGRFDEGAELADRALAAGEQAQRSDAILSHRIHTFTLRRFLGGLESVEDPVRRSVDEYPARPMFRCMLALLYAATGRAEDARPLFDELASDGFTGVPRSNEWLFSLSMLAEVAEALADAVGAAALYELLEPYAERNGATADYICTGPVSRYLGILAVVRGRWDEAERWFEDAVERGRRMGAGPFVASTLHDHGRLLRARGGDPERAGALLEEARRWCRRLGMPALEERVISELEPAAAAGAHPAESGGRRQVSTFSREGDYWTIEYEGREFRLRDLKGLHYLARLLAEPGREFHALDLVTAETGAPEVGLSSEPGLDLGSEDAGPVLDARAKAEYRSRLADLEGDIEEAAGVGDAERAARAREERDFLVHELARAVGLGGRDRRAASAAERARVSVTRAIRTSLARIRQHDSGLGDHLDRTIRTGFFCSYAPDPRAPAEWRF